MTTDLSQPGVGEHVSDDGIVDAVAKTPLERLIEQREIPREEAVIALIDDEAAIARLGGRMLTRETGIRAETAEDGEAGLDLIESFRGRIVVVISDVNMPKKTGPKMLKEASESGALEDVAVVVMSGRMSDNARDIAEATAGRLDPVLIEKPFHAETLVLAVQEACQKVLDKIECASKK